MRTCSNCRGLLDEGTTSSCPQCGHAFATMRFKLNPTSDSEPPRPTQAPPLSQAPAGAPSKGGAARTARSRFTPRQAFVAAIVLAALVLFGSGTAAYLEFAPSGRYPERYLLEEDELPAGLSLLSLPDQAKAELGVSSNPGEMKKAKLADFESDSGVRPVEGWLEVFGSGGFSFDAALFAFRFSSSGDAEAWVQESLDECGASTLAYRWGSVVVFVASESGNAEPALKVAAALREKSPRLSAAC